MTTHRAIAAMRVEVRADDPLSAEGVLRHLREIDSVIVGAPADVVLFAATRFTEDLLTRLRSVGGTPVVLVINMLMAAELHEVVESGVAAVVPTRLATRGALEASLISALSGRRTPVYFPRDAEPSVLSFRETQVLSLLAQGLTTREVAERVHLSERSIKALIADFQMRHDLRSRPHAVAYAIRHGHI